MKISKSFKDKNFKSCKTFYWKFLDPLENFAYLIHEISSFYLYMLCILTSFWVLSFWKACNVENYPIQLEPNHDNLIPNDRIVRSTTTRHWKEDGKTNTARDSFSRSTAKIWNQAPTNIKECKSITLAKKLIKTYCKSLPV